MRHQIQGSIMQTLAIDLDSGETVFSQTNCMAWMSDTIDMKTNTGGGFFAGVGRMLSGSSFFITDFTARTPGKISFAPRFPGSILAFKLGPGESIVCRKQTFMCAEKSVQLANAYQRKLGAGFFAGEGFIMQSVTGPGTVWLDLSGEVVTEDLAPGQRLLVHAGHIGAQSPTVNIDIQMVRGFKNVLFGGEGLFLATLTGPGKVWLQSMPIMNLAESIAHYLPHQSSGGETVGEGVAGGLLGAAIKGMMKG
jgi:uncharacterized protein (TIGR00266 family)